MMLRPLRTTVVALAAWLFACSAAPVAAQEASGAVQAREPARITGHVIDPQTGAGMAFVRVELVEESRATVTDAEGKFVFEGVSRRLHTLVARLEGYEPAAPRTVDAREASEVTVELELRLNIVTNVRAPAAARDLAALPGAVVTRLDARQITTQPGSVEDVFRVLQMTPGVAAVDDNRNDLLVRGAGPIESEIRIDGFSTPNASHFSGQGGTAGGISALPPWLIERASLEPGGFSVVFGERASSVVDLTVRAGNLTRLAGTVAAGVGGGWAVVEGPLPRGRGSWLASARRSFLELVIDQTGEEVRPRYFDAVGKLDLQLSSRHQLGFLVFGGQDNVVARSDVDGFETFRDDQWTGLAGVRLMSQWTGLTTSRLGVSFGVNDLSVVARDRKAIDFSDDSRETELRVTGEVTRAIGTVGTVLVGGAVKRANLSYNLYEEAFRNEYNNPVVAVRSNNRDAFVDLAAYGELTASAGTRLRLRAGLRVDRSGSSRGVYGSPRVRAEYRLAPTVRVTGAWGIYRQGIPYIWIGSSPENATLDPVRSQHLIAGVSVTLRRSTSVVVEGFDKRYTGYPVDPVAPSRVLISALADFESPFVGTLVSEGRVRARGLDAALSTALCGHVTAALSYSLWKVTQRGLDGVWRPGDYDIRHQVRLAFGYHRAPWSATASWRYASGRPYTPYDVAASTKARAGRYDRTRINGERYIPYHRLDVRAERTFRIKKVRLAAYGEVNNLYDRANVYLFEWDTTLKRATPINQWGLTPIGGVRVEF